MTGAIMALAASGGGLNVVRTYSTAGSGTDTIPSGASQVVIEVWGGGAGGSDGDVLAPSPGGGGGSGGYVKKTLALTGGDAGLTFSYVVGANGGANANGQASTVVNGTYGTATSLSAGGGETGDSAGMQGNGGTASGGDVNTAGNGSNANFTRTGAGAPLGGGNVSGGSAGSAPGGGGSGGDFSGGPGAVGAAGRVVFTYT